MSTNPKPRPDAETRYRGLESVPIRVTVRAGRARVTLARLSAIEPGQVLVLDTSVGAPFDLIAGAVLLGRVGPVAVGESVGFKLIGPAEDERDPSR